MNTRPILSLLCVLSTVLHATPPPEFTVLRTQYEKALIERVSGPFDAALAELNTKFTAALDSAATTAKQAGKLDDVLAIQDDKKRLTEKLPIPDDEEQTPESLKKLRAIYRGQLGKLEEARSANHQALLPAYTAKLQELEVILTKADRIDEAKELKTYRLALASGVTAPATPGSPAAASTREAALTAKKTDPSVKGDHRKAAEWLIQVGGHFDIDERGKKSTPVKPEDLPKGKFIILGIGLDGRDAKEAITAEGLTNLAGLQTVTSINIGQLEWPDEQFAFLSALPSLERVLINRCPRVTDAIVDHLVPLKKLTEFGCGGSNGFTGATLDKLAEHRLLTKFSSGASGFNAAGAAALAQLQGITSLGFEGSGALDDEAIPHLAKLSKLRSLGVTDTSITPEGLAALNLPLGFLDCGRLSGKTPRDFAAIVGPAFPDVISLRLPQCERYTPADFEALVHFKKLEVITTISLTDPNAWAGLRLLPQIKRLTVDRRPFTDAAIDHLLAAPSLNSIQLMGSDITDAGLLNLAGLKTLKTLTVKDSPITDAGIAAFKKQRSDVKFSR